MDITYTVAEYTTEDLSVEVTYTNEIGYVHKRMINIPKDNEGNIDQTRFDQILEDQLRGLKNKVSFGAVTFKDPNSSDDVPSD
jgi:hypothetical protein